MRARLTLAAALALTGTLAAAPVTAQFYKPVPGLTVYADAEYKGTNTTFTADTPDISATGLGRMISSLRVGQGESWQVCTEPNYGGRCRTFTNSVSNLRDISWNDVIMSVRRVPAPAGPTPTSPTGPATPVSTVPLAPATGLELYAGTNYSGRRQILRESTPDFRQIDFSDRAISLRVPRNSTWEICVNVDFDECRLISEDVPDLAAIGLSRVISSARPQFGGGGGRGGRARIVFYDSTNFRGRSVTIEDDRPSVTTSISDTGSIRVYGGDWQVCDRPRFFGNCVAIAEDVRDLSRLGLRGPVASIRRNQERDRD